MQMAEYVTWPPSTLGMGYSYATHMLGIRQERRRHTGHMLWYAMMYDTLAIGQIYAMYTFITLCMYMSNFTPVRFWTSFNLLGICNLFHNIWHTLMQYGNQSLLLNIWSINYSQNKVTWHCITPLGFNVPHSVCASPWSYSDYIVYMHGLSTVQYSTALVPQIHHHFESLLNTFYGSFMTI